MLVYLTIMLVGMSLYGVEAWTRNADAFGVLFGCFAALAPVTRRDGVLYARPPVVGAGRLPAGPGMTAVLLVGIGATAFDGAKEGPLFNDAVPDLQELFQGLGFSQGTALELGFVAGLLAVCGFVALVWTLGVAGMPRLRGGASPGPALAHSLAPILAAYVVAHYFSLLAYNGQDLLRLASDPLGTGADLLGTADATIDYGVVSATGDLVRPGRRAGRRARRRPRARARSRARAVPRPSGSQPLADGHAGRYGDVHRARVVAALGGERMTALPLAHAGHWLAQVAYAVPLVLVVVALVVTKVRERRGGGSTEEAEAEPAAPPPEPAAGARQGP